MISDSVEVTLKKEDLAHVYGQCVHGQCLEHEPDWQDGVSEFIPTTGLFGRKNYLFIYCCGSPMAHYKEVGLNSCKKCSRKELVTRDSEVAFCRCCHRHHSTYIPPVRLP